MKTPEQSLHDESSFQLRISSVNVTKSLMEHLFFCAVYVRNLDYLNYFYSPKICISQMSQTVRS